MKQKKTAQQLTRAQPGNYFITVSKFAISMPKVTGAHVGAKHGEKFILTGPDKRTLHFTRSDKGQVVCRNYKNTMMFYGKLRIFERGFKFGRYQYCPEQSTEEQLTFKYDPLWV